MADGRRLPRWARWTAIGCTAAVLGATGYLVAGAVPTSAGGADLRTATVSTGSVTQTIALSGSVERVDQVTAAFRTGGTVTSVKVSVGDEVVAGDVLATISTAGLKRAVTVARANLVAAQAALDAAGSSSTSGSTSGSSGASGSSGSSGSGGSSSSATPTSTPTRTGGSGSTPNPGSTVDTSSVHRAVEGYDTLVSAALEACQPLLDGGSDPEPNPTPTPTPSPTPSDTATPTPTQSPSSTPSSTPTTSSTPDAGDHATTTPARLTSASDDGPTADQVGACVRALSSALTSAQRTASDMDRLVTALDAAAKALQAQQASTAAQGSSGQGVTGSAATSGTSTGTSAGGGGQGGSAASLAVDVLQATQELAAAEQDLDAAVLRAPISGTVGQVDLTKGEQAGTTSGVVVVGPGAAVVTVDLPLAQLSRVRVDQDVVVTPAGTTEEVAGVVQSIGVLPSSTTSSTPTYPVRVTVSDAPVTLAAGSTATATITLATATDVLTVPVSAVSGVSAGSGTVQVLADGATRATTVAVGAVGGGKVQVEDGLTAGQVVVLADPTTPLPSADGNRFRRSTTSGVSGLTGQGGPPRG